MLSLAEKLSEQLANLQIVDDEPEACERCHGFGTEIIPSSGARLCECRRASLYDRRLAKANIPALYTDCTLRGFKIDNQFALIKVRQKMIDFVNVYPAVERGLMLMGSCGVGKTHLAVAALKALIQKGATGVFYVVGDLLKTIQNSYNPATESAEMDILAPVVEADILVLDELGAARPTAWVGETLLHIINTRYNEKRITIFTTNYLDERKREREETLQDRIGARLRSRLFEMCQTVLIEAEDYRRKTNGGAK